LAPLSSRPICEAVEQARQNHKSGLETGDEQASGIILDVWARASGGDVPEELLQSELQRSRHDTQGTMQVYLDDGQCVRIRTADFAFLTDDVLGVLMDSLSPYSVNYELLKTYSLQQPSLSALRELYCRYKSFQTAEELKAIAKTVRTCHIRERYISWLPPGEERGIPL
jgi:hypothetical protein